MQQVSDNASDATNKGQVASTLPQAKKQKPKLKERKYSIRKMGRPKKLGAFDSDLLKLVKRGTRRVSDILSLLAVDEGEADKRIQLLCQMGWILKDPNDPQMLSITVKAYNEFRPPSLMLSTERKAERRAQRLPQSNKTNSADLPSLLVEPKSPNASLEHLKPATARLDLNELLERGAGKVETIQTDLAKDKLLKSEAPQVNAGVLEKAKTDSKPTESCELCKEEFKLAVVGGNAKYGHCFCGAAYHKDCYEGVLEADGRCVRCGRKLDLAMQKETRDEMNKIKSVFGD